MSYPKALIAVAAVIVVAGCTDVHPGLEHRHEVNAWIARSLERVSIENAIIRQHTMFPYHFVSNTAKLNRLGRTELAVLAGHFRVAPGVLNVRKGDATEDVYGDRVDAVRKYLAEAKVDVDDVRFLDGLPGGDGVSTDRLLEALEKKEEKAVDPGSGTVVDGARQGGER